MAIQRSEIRPEILARPCEKCGEAIGDVDCVITFYRGEFILLHQECADFIDHATRGPRGHDPTKPPPTIT
jgi:hypothetical protein